MLTHREFVQDEVGPLADLVFVGCSMADAAEPLAPSGGATPRRQVVLNGRRIKTVDIHAHCAVPAAMALMGMTVSPEILRIGPERLPQMDAQGIDVEALSINPYPWTRTAVEHILGTPSLSDTERAAILGDTACTLLGIAP